jgi:YidC/Oxa1 family membrane protein insertase
MESMKKMKSYSKELEKLKLRHKGDRTKLAKAQADFYKEKGINPSAGCLPYLLQIVVLIFLFRLFSSVFTLDGNVAEKFNQYLYEPLKFVASQEVHTRFLYLDITKPDKLNDLLSLSSLPIPIPGIFLILASAFQFLSAKMSVPFVEAEKKAAKQTKGQGDDFQVAMQSSMVYTFPLITLLVGVSFPSSLALYWLSFSVFQVWQQYQASGWGGAAPLINKLQKLVKAS